MLEIILLMLPITCFRKKFQLILQAAVARSAAVVARAMRRVHGAWVAGEADRVMQMALLIIPSSQKRKETHD